MALTTEQQAARTRLASYNINQYNASTNLYGLGGVGYKTNIPAAYNDTAVIAQAVVDEADRAVSAAILNGTIASSTTSNSIATGSKNFTVETGKGFPTGLPVKAVDNANTANFMTGAVTSYNSGTGALVIEVDATGGSGTLADWAVYPNISTALGDVVGPASVTDEALPVFSGTSGKLLKASAVVIDVSASEMALNGLAMTDLKLGGQADGNGQAVINLYGKSEAAATPADAATVTLNRALGDSRKITVPSSGTITIAVSNFPASEVSRYRLEMVNGGAGTVNWPGGITAISLTASGRDVLMIERNSDGTYRLFPIALGLS